MRRAFTLLEIVIVVSIIGILVGLIAPPYQQVRRKAVAARVVGDVHAIRVAAMTYYADRKDWPAETHTGQTPDELRTYLPGGFSFRKAEYTLDWDRWDVPGGIPRFTIDETIVGISVVTDDSELGYEVRRLIGPTINFQVGERYTFIVEGLTADGGVRGGTELSLVPKRY